MSGAAADDANDNDGWSVPGLTIGVVLVLWVVAVFFGTIGETLPHEAIAATRDGQALDFCVNIDPDFDGSSSMLCTLDGEEFAVSGSLDVVYHSGAPLLEWDLVKDNALEAFLQPSFWLAVGLGTAAVITLFTVARATGTYRAGLATSVTLIFFGLVLFPNTFTAGLGGDVRAELINAWKVVIAFYFGSEAAVQAFKVFHPSGQAVTGDVPDPPAPD